MKSPKSISIFILIFAITSVYSTLSSAIILDGDFRPARTTFIYGGDHPDDMKLEKASQNGFSIIFPKEISLVINRKVWWKGQKPAQSILRLEVIASDPYLSSIGQEVIQEQIEKFYKLNPRMKEKKLFSTRISPTLFDKGDAYDFVGTDEFIQFVHQLAQALSLLQTLPQDEWPVQAWEEFIYQIKNWPEETSSSPSEREDLEVKIIRVLAQGGEFPSRLKLALFEAARDHGIEWEWESLQVETLDSQSFAWDVLTEALQKEASKDKWHENKIIFTIITSLENGAFRLDSPPYKFRLLLQALAKDLSYDIYARRILELRPGWKLSFWDHCEHLLRRQ